MTSLATVQHRLLSDADGAPVEVINPAGTACVVLACEHASNLVPVSLQNLGLPSEVRESHVAWDPGAREVAVGLSQKLDAPLVAARISRLVYDCNRPPDSAAAMPAKSEIFDIPGNSGLSDSERALRIQEVYEPFQHRLSGMIDERFVKHPTCLVTIHSFTPVYFAKKREVELGVLHDDDTRLADMMLKLASELTPLRTGRNQPYGPQDGVTHTLKLHGLSRGIPNVMIEIRNDLLKTPEAIKTMTETLARLITQATDSLKVAEGY
jgi:predicted N-formylglutamate amidohydrolase